MGNIGVTCVTNQLLYASTALKKCVLIDPPRSAKMTGQYVDVPARSLVIPVSNGRPADSSSSSNLIRCPIARESPEAGTIDTAGWAI